jgi:hypothetical protein
MYKATLIWALVFEELSADMSSQSFSLRHELLAQFRVMCDESAA